MSQGILTAGLEECDQSTPLISTCKTYINYVSIMQVGDSNGTLTLVNNLVVYVQRLLVQVKDVISSWSPVMTPTTPTFVIRPFLTSVHLTMYQG